VEIHSDIPMKDLRFHYTLSEYIDAAGSMDLNML